MDKILLVMALTYPGFISAATTGSSSACFRGWSYWGGSCYRVFQSSNQSTWNTSQTTCHQNGGDLVEIADSSEQKFLISLPFGGTEMWIGVYQEASGDWKLRNGDAPTLSSLPALSMTNPSASPQCGTLFGNGSLGGRTCDSKLHFICEANPVDCTALHAWHHCLWFSDADDSWPNTRRTCHQFFTDLASFSNPAEISTLRTKLRLNVSYWVGIQFRPPSSGPIWLDGLTETDSTRFPILNGATPGAAGVYCGCVRLGGSGSLEWGLDDCTSSKPFICERKVLKDNQTKTTTAAAATHHSASYTPTTTYDTDATAAPIAAPTSAQRASSSQVATMSAVVVTGKPTSARHPNPTTFSAHLTMSPAHPRTHHVTQLTTTSVLAAVEVVDSILAAADRTYRPKLPMRPRSLTRRGLPAHIHPISPAHVRTRRSRRCHSHLFHVNADECCYNEALLRCAEHLLTLACRPPYPRCTSASRVVFSSTTAHAQTLTSASTSSTATTATAARYANPPTGIPADARQKKILSTMASKETAKRRISSTFQSPALKDNMHFSQNENLALCSESDQPLDCLMVHIQDGDLAPEVTYRALFKLFLHLRISITIAQSQQAKTNFENFFRILNFFIEGSYSTHWHKYNMSLCDILSIVEVFLNSNIKHLPLRDVMRRAYSHVEILIKRLPGNGTKHFRYHDKNGLGNITSIHPTVPLNTSFNDDVVVAVVLMKVPVLNVAFVDSNSSGLVLSPVLSLTAYSKERHVSLTHTFNLLHRNTGDQFSEQEKGGHLLQCVFWDNSSRAWSTYGCTMTSSNNLTSQCHCNHTTNFAILMQINDFELAASDKIALEVITYIGCSVALITQVFAITIYTFVGSLNSERVYMYVHRNLCIAIVCAQVTFLAGIDAVQHRLVCAAVALVLHYFYTAVFVWMLVEGLHLYSKVVQVFGTERSRMIYYMTFGWAAFVCGFFSRRSRVIYYMTFGWAAFVCGFFSRRSRMIYYMTFGWGVPVILVTISAAADWEGYGTAHSCWLSTSRKTIWTFVGPALAIIIVNMVILAAVIRIVISSSKLEKHGEYDHIRAGIKGALFLLPLLGLTWVFGLAAANQRLVVFQYLFAIFNSLQRWLCDALAVVLSDVLLMGYILFLQKLLKSLSHVTSVGRYDLVTSVGFFISMFHCAFNGEVRQALRRLREKRQLRRGDLSSGSQSTGSQMSDTWAMRTSRPYPVYRHNQVAPLATMGTTTTRLNSPTPLKELDDGDHEREREELSLMYI